MNTLKTSLGLILAAMLIGLTLNACDSNDSDDDPGLEIDPDFIIAESFTAQADSVVTTESGLQYLEIETGTGEQAEAGDTAYVHYIGQLTDGGEFDNSYTRGAPLPLVLREDGAALILGGGGGGVIPGFGEGVFLMREGETAQILIPPELGYRDIGSGPIPPNATIAFQLELAQLDK